MHYSNSPQFQKINILMIFIYSIHFRRDFKHVIRSEHVASCTFAFGIWLCRAEQFDESRRVDDTPEGLAVTYYIGTDRS